MISRRVVAMARNDMKRKLSIMVFSKLLSRALWLCGALLLVGLVPIVAQSIESDTTDEGPVSGSSTTLNATQLDAQPLVVRFPQKLRVQECSATVPLGNGYDLTVSLSPLTTSTWAAEIPLAKKPNKENHDIVVVASYIDTNRIVSHSVRRAYEHNRVLDLTSIEWPTFEGAQLPSNDSVWIHGTLPKVKGEVTSVKCVNDFLVGQAFSVDVQLAGKDEFYALLTIPNSTADNQLHEIETLSTLKDGTQIKKQVAVTILRRSAESNR